MPRMLPVALAWIVLVAASGCDEKKTLKEVSDGNFLLSQQHQLWHKARETLQSDHPGISQVAIVWALLGGRTQRRVEMDYAGANKAQVLQRLGEIRQGFQQEVLSRLDTTGPMPVLRPGVSIGDLRDAFMRLDPAYRELEAMTAAKG